MLGFSLPSKLATPQSTSLCSVCLPLLQAKTIWPVPSWVILVGFNIHVLFIDHFTTIWPSLRYSFIFHHFNPLDDLRVVVVVVVAVGSFDLIVNNPLVEGHFSVWVAFVVGENTWLPSNSSNVVVVVLRSQHSLFLCFVDQTSIAWLLP